MTTTLRRFVNEEQGQDLAEYALLVCFVVITNFGLACGFHNSIAGVENVNGSNLASPNMAIR